MAHRVDAPISDGRSAPEANDVAELRSVHYLIGSVSGFRGAAVLANRLPRRWGHHRREVRALCIATISSAAATSPSAVGRSVVDPLARAADDVRC
jgi:hypothetical protein